MLALAIGDIIEHAVVHDPFLPRELRVLRVLDMADLACAVELLQRDALQALTVRVVTARVEQPLDLAVLDILKDDMVLRLRARVPLDLIIDDVAVGGIRPRHDMLIEEDRHNAHEEAEEDGRHRDAEKADAA